MAAWRTHLNLPDAELSGKDVYVIGDVHGCYYELMDLLNIIQCIDQCEVKIQFKY